MHKVKLIFLVLIITSQINNVLLSQDVWVEIARFGEGTFMNPGGFPIVSFNSIITDNHGKIFVYDSQGTYPLYIVNTVDKSITGFGEWGNGPGELARGTPKGFSQTEKRIYVFEYIERKVTIFNYEGVYINNFVLPAFLGPIGYAHVISDNSMLYRIDFYPPNVKSSGFVKLLEYSEDGRINDINAYLVRYDEHPDLKPIINNATLKSGPISSDRDGFIYIANMYSSLILCINQDGETVFKTYEPYDARIPNVPLQAQGTIISGEPDKATHYSLSIDTDDKYLYALHSGIEYRSDDIAKALQIGDTDNLRVGEGNTLLIYDKRSGEYIDSIELPVWTSNIVVDDEYIYFLVLERDPYIVQYLKPIIER